MPFREKSFPFYFASLLVAGFGALQFFTGGGVPSHSSSGYSLEMASQARVPSSSREHFETIESCGPERAYFLQGLNNLPADYRQTRQQVADGGLPRSCVSYIMNNFIDARINKSMSYGYCGNTSGQPTRGADGTGYLMPCVTESYVNSVYNSIADVSDCLNIPIKELMPKLANESGLHVNTLGPDADGGVGQLTRSALSEVYMRYENIPNRESTLVYFLNEMKKSSKKSCQRILAQKSAYQIEVPKGQKLCLIHETDANCFKPWMVQSRCEFMTMPNNPLRNVLFTAVYYRSMHKSATGVNYRAGEDVIWTDEGSVPMKQDLAYGGFIGRKEIVERLTNLGLRNPSPEVVRQILVSFGFNGGIGTGQTLLDNWLKLREARNLKLREEDLDFQAVSIAPWSLITNAKSYLSLITEPDETEFQKQLARLDSVRNVKLDPLTYSKKVIEVRKKVRKILDPLEKNMSEDEIKKARLAHVDKSEELRREVLNDVFDRSEFLTLPEFMRVGHAWSIAFKKGGGAPGYLTFLANKHKELEAQMGAGTCTEKQYLQF